MHNQAALLHQSVKAIPSKTPGAFDTHPRKHNSIIPRPPHLQRGFSIRLISSLQEGQRFIFHPVFQLRLAQRKTGYLEML